MDLGKRHSFLNRLPVKQGKVIIQETPKLKEVEVHRTSTYLLGTKSRRFESLEVIISQAPSNVIYAGGLFTHDCDLAKDFFLTFENCREGKFVPNVLKSLAPPSEEDDGETTIEREGNYHLSFKETYLPSGYLPFISAIENLRSLHIRDTHMDESGFIRIHAPIERLVVENQGLNAGSALGLRNLGNLKSLCFTGGDFPCCFFDQHPVSNEDTQGYSPKKERSQAPNPPKAS